MNESFHDWSAYFELNAAPLLNIDWEGEGPLRLEEIDWIFSSIRQFQRGFQTDGRQLLEGVRRYFEGQNQENYITALEYYVGEKKRHAGLLARFMEQKRIPKMSIHWLDALFRGIRRNVELSKGLSILGVAEVIAKVYFEALKGATESEILVQVCDQIISDGTNHAYFMGCSLHLIAAGDQKKIQRLFQFQRRLLRISQPVLWWIHYEVLKASGFTYQQFRKATEAGLKEVHAFSQDDLHRCIKEKKAGSNRAMSRTVE